jgi:hypothetical protein
MGRVTVPIHRHPWQAARFRKNLSPLLHYALCNCDELRLRGLPFAKVSSLNKDGPRLIVVDTCENAKRMRLT